MTGTVRMYGGTSFDYCKIEDSHMDIETLSGGKRPTWDMQTLFRIDFSNGLVAGNMSEGDQKPSSYDIYKSKNGDVLEYAATVDADNGSFIDYAVTNNSDYVYYIYPSNENYIGVPVVADNIHTRWNSWYLFVCDDVSDDGNYYVNSIYDFEFDIGDVQYQNNTSVNKLTTFSRYPRIQKDITDAFSGTLSSLIGVFDCSENRYYETADMTDAIRQLSTNTNPKFLRDMEGHFYRVEVSSAITFAQSYYLNSYKTSKSLEWQEIGSSKNARVISR